MSALDLALVLAIALPLALAVAATLGRWPALSALLPAAPVPALAVALLAPADGAVVLPDMLFGLVLGLDPISRTFLGLTALLWTVAGFYSRTYLRADARRRRFDALWLATLAGNLGLIVAQDVAGFYAFFTLMTLASFGLVIHDGTPFARHAGVVYIVLSVLGETSLLLGFMAAAATADSFLIADLRAAIAAAPERDLILALLVVGFGIKAGTVPLHVWLPLAHPAAPTPASAVLSGAIIKAGIVGWLKFMPLGEIALPDWGTALAVLGLFTSYYGVLAGLPQANPKVVLAYSSLSQMGLILVVVGVALAEPSATPVALAAAALYAVHHGLAKGALFLGVGVLAASGRHRKLVLAGQALPALAIAGLPLTSGALAKAELIGAITAGPDAIAGPVAAAATLGVIGTALLMGRFLVVTTRTDRPKDAAAAPSAGLWLPWLATLLAAHAASWWLFLAQRPDAVAYATAPAHLWGGLWPILVAGILAAFALVLSARGRFPRVTVPEGDLVALAPPIGRAAATFGARLAAYGSRLRDRSRTLARWLTAGPATRGWSSLDERLRRSATAGVGLLLVVGLLVAMLAA